MNWFWHKNLREMGVGTQTAGLALFEQFDGVSVMESVLEVKDSCKSLVGMFGMCLISFLLCPYAEMIVVTSYGTFLLS